MYWAFNLLIFVISLLFFNKYSSEVEKNEEFKQNSSFNFEKYGQILDKKIIKQTGIQYTNYFNILQLFLCWISRRDDRSWGRGHLDTSMAGNEFSE